MTRLVLVAGGTATAAVLLYSRRRLAGTTLLAPWWWSLAALGSVLGTELIIIATWGDSAESQRWIEPTRYIAQVTMLCPAIALLGAKRPQDRAWQLIVLSLWAILALPAATALLFPRAVFQISPVWSWFLLALIAIGVLNYLPTRFWPACLVLGAAQTLLLWRHLPRPQTAALRHADLAGFSRSGQIALTLVLIGTAILLAQWIAARYRRKYFVAAAGQPCTESLDVLWLDFRDSFGALWGLRVAERVNTVLARQDCKIELRWSGWHCLPSNQNGSNSGPPTAIPPESAAVVATTATSILRRFVSAEWIDSRICAKDTSS